MEGATAVRIPDSSAPGPSGATPPIPSAVPPQVLDLQTSLAISALINSSFNQEVPPTPMHFGELQGHPFVFKLGGSRGRHPGKNVAHWTEVHFTMRNIREKKHYIYTEFYCLGTFGGFVVIVGSEQAFPVWSKLVCMSHLLP